ncbi:hypothetical protein AMAG_10883 [Allomyces macrogynus ATCC 38327]|uniref:Uncharacterized protein n=1 Tax=Allomyces macrogynus (strain ATCC 38327) TaxID=578462 RepID=A0A0L0SS98_ALLM3|nr:hypothetical protein AMAG_10883 [Allomyces macrogynus ATCC 38327]|eukprot:KNE65239.1 hypothetical protein AMAG_10883 [Allomyces macrogynus ATCC 38327]
MSQLSSAHALGRAHHAAYVPPGPSAAAANPAVGRASAGPWTPRRAASPAHALASTSRSGLYEPPSVRAANAGYAPSPSSLSIGPAVTTQAAPGVFSKERLLRIRESAPPGPNLLDDPTGEHALVVADAPLAPLAVLPMTEAEHQALATGNIHPEGVGKKPDTSTSQTRPGAARAVPGRGMLSSPSLPRCNLCNM